MNNSVQIRKALEKDIPAIRHIARITWPVAYGTILSQEQLEYMLDKMYSTTSLQQQIAQGHRFYLAEVNDTAYGFASVSDEGNSRFKLNKLYVIPDTQKTGAGKALLQEAIGYAKQHGGKQLFLQVNRNNNAKGFYEKHGFAIVDEVKLDIGNGFFMDDYIMQLEI